MQNRGTFCLKKYFNMERSKGIFVREILRNTIVNENVLHSEGSLMYYHVLAIICSNSLSHIVR